MSDRLLILEILDQISKSIRTIQLRFKPVHRVNDFLETPEGMEKLDGICMQLIAIGESLKNLDKITSGELFARHPEIDWRGAKRMRDIICHHYFDIDAEAIFLVCRDKISPLGEAIEKMKREV